MVGTETSQIVLELSSHQNKCVSSLASSTWNHKVKVYLPGGGTRLVLKIRSNSNQLIWIRDRLKEKWAVGLHLWKLQVVHYLCDQMEHQDWLRWSFLLCYFLQWPSGENCVHPESVLPESKSLLITVTSTKLFMYFASRAGMGIAIQHSSVHWPSEGSISGGFILITGPFLSVSFEIVAI